MYVIGAIGDDVNEYSLSTAFDVSTVNYAGNAERFYVGNEESIPLGMAFNNDGTKMYIIGMTGDEVNEYTLSTGFDVSTASYTQLFSVAAQETNPTGMAFNNDGTKMYVVGSTGKDVNEYVLSTGFDVSTATHSQVFSVASHENAPSGMAFNNDGTKMFVIGHIGDEVNEYSLTTAFDISTASYVQNFSVAAQDLIPTGMSFDDNGSKMYVVGTDGDKVYEYSLDNPSSPTVCVNSAITNITFNTTGATGIGTPTNLPTGVTAAWSSNVLTISGTPTVAGTYAYSVPLTGGCGTVAATGTITVTGDNTAAAPSATPTLCPNDVLTDITIATTGATGIGTPTDLPAGVTASWSSDVITITGTPTVAGTYNYSIPLTGGCGTVSATGTITVLPTEDATFSYDTTNYCTVGSDPTPTITGTTGGVFSATPTGLTISASTGEIDLDASTTGTYTVQYITSTSTCADTATASVTVETCADNDGDGIPDVSDLDDDNDGILDEDECPGINSGNTTNLVNNLSLIHISEPTRPY